MSIRTTVTLEEDVLARLKEHSRRKGISFKEAINDVLRNGLLAAQAPAAKPKLPEGRDLGFRPGLNYDDIGGLLEAIEGPYNR